MTDKPVIIVLNIGLKLSNRFDWNVGQTVDVSPSLALIQTIQIVGGDVLYSNIRESDTEPTLVVHLRIPDDSLWSHVMGSVYRLSHVLQQDCIAFKFKGHTGGQLVGPHASEWGGKFDNQYFIDE